MTAYGTATITANGVSINQLVVATDFQGSFETKDLDFERPQYNKLIDGVLIDIEPDKTLEIAFGTRERLTEDLTWTDWYEVAGNRLTSPSPRVPEARFIRIRLRDPVPERVWRLTNIRLYGRVVGAPRSRRAASDDANAA